MDPCALCNGRMIKTEYDMRCLNNNCDNSKLEKREGHHCLVCNTKLDFKNNTAYGDRIYWCPECQKEFTL